MADKQKKEKKENFFTKTVKAIASYIKATKSELKKVTWPSKKQLVNNTVIVIVCIAIVTAVILVLDTIFGGLFGLFTGGNKTTVDEIPTEVETVQEVDPSEDTTFSTEPATNNEITE